MNLMRHDEGNFPSKINETVIFVICNWLVCNLRSLFIAKSVFIQFIRFKHQSKSTHNSTVAPWESLGCDHKGRPIELLFDGKVGKEQKTKEMKTADVKKNGKMLDYVLVEG